MTLKTYKFVSGVDKENTRYASEGRWWDMQNVRFRSGTPEKIGGWIKQTAAPYNGVCRALFDWVDLSNNNLLSIGTNTNVYVEQGGLIYDITPIAQEYTDVTSPSTVDCIQTFDNLYTIQINLSGMSAAVGQPIIISGADAVGGVPAGLLNGTHTITEITSSYVQFEISSAGGWSAGGWGSFGWGENGAYQPVGAIGGGVNIIVSFLLAPGNVIASDGTGWGAGVWSRGTWGSATNTQVAPVSQPRLWSFDNFGENLLLNVRGGEIFYWQPAAGPLSNNRAVPLSDLPGATSTPLFANVVLSTEERFVMAFGTNPVGSTEQDPLQIRWSDQEEPAKWYPDPTNAAGDIRIGLGSYIVGAQQTRQEVLVWTDASLHSVQYIGAPYQFSLQTLSSNTSLISPNAAITVNNVTYWMGNDKFYAYSGRVETLPCSLRRFVYSDINLGQAFQVQCGADEYFGEIYWFYCSKDSTVIDKYVVFNYLENIWYYGAMPRTAWRQSNTRSAIYGASYDGYIYQQEIGCDDGSTEPPSPIVAYIESADFDIDDGDKFSFIKRIIPDITFQNSTTATPSVNYTLKARNFPGATFDQADIRNVSAVTNQIDQYTNQVWIRVRGRQAAVRVESNGLGVMWQIGNTRLDLRPDGRR